jgi:hypothetical protein
MLPLPWYTHTAWEKRNQALRGRNLTRNIQARACRWCVRPLQPRVVRGRLFALHRPPSPFLRKSDRSSSARPCPVSGHPSSSEKLNRHALAYRRQNLGLRWQLRDALNQLLSVSYALFRHRSPHAACARRQSPEALVLDNPSRFRFHTGITCCVHGRPDPISDPPSSAPRPLALGTPYWPISGSARQYSFLGACKAPAGNSPRSR